MIDKNMLPARFMDRWFRRLAYTEVGSGPPVLLLHGWMCNRHFWAPVLTKLAKSFHVWAVDFPGHGESTRPAVGYTIEDLAVDIEAFIIGNQLTRPAIVGHSMGGMVGQQFALMYPDSIGALGLITTIAADPERRLLSRKIVAESERLGFRAAFDEHLLGWFGEDTPHNVVDWVRREMLRTDERVGRRLAVDYGDFDLRNRLPDIAVPTLVVSGGHDGSALPSESSLLSELIPNAQHVSLASVGHFPMLENTVGLVRVLEDFLHRHFGT